MRELLTNLPVWQKRLATGIYDFVVLTVAMWLAFSLRLGEWDTIFSTFGIYIVAAPITAIPLFIYTGLYCLVMRHLGYRVLWLTAKGVTLSALAWSVVPLMISTPGLPRSVIFIYWFIAFAFVVGGRLWARALLRKSSGTPVVIYGAGSEGVQLAVALQYGTDYRPLAFLDDNLEMQGSEVASLRVYAPSDPYLPGIE